MCSQPTHRIRAFTLIELLVVIAIIAILAAILFPVFSTVREQARQSSTMSNMHSTYVGAKLYNEDEGRFPTSLFGYAEVALTQNLPTDPAARPATTSDAQNTITPMSKATGIYTTTLGLNHGYLFGEQVKDYTTFLCDDDLIAKKLDAQTETTIAYYPLNSPLANGALTPVTWKAPGTGTCAVTGDADLPKDPSYVGLPKVYYKTDSMDIGPMLKNDGTPMLDNAGNQIYELHYTPDWTQQVYNAANSCDVNASGNPIVTQLKYKNPPSENTIITWNTFHAATAGSPNVIILMLSGTARKIKYAQALQQLPLNYK